nr:heparinase II/III-family protein [Chitinophagaceae bacterium]
FVGTLAHNTICIDNTNQSYQAGPTMWLNHYKVNVLQSKKEEDIELVSAEHTGFKKMGCTHQRTVQFIKGKESFLITDRIGVNNKAHNIIQPWHLHPEVEINKINDHQYLLKHKNSPRSVKISLDSKLSFQLVYGQLEPILGWYSTSFLKKEPTTVIKGSLNTKKTQEINIYTTIEII